MSGDVVDLVDALAWPIVLLALVLFFRRPLTSLVTEIREFSGFGLSARRGDREASRLLENLSSDEPESSDMAVITADVGVRPLDENEVVSHAKVVRFSYNMSNSKLNSLQKQLDAEVDEGVCRSVGLGAYREVLTFVRSLELLSERAGPNDVPLYEGPYAHRQLGILGAPETLVRDVSELKEFHQKLNDGTLAVTPAGARTFVRACRDTLHGMYAWRTGVQLPAAGVMDRAAKTLLPPENESGTP